MSSYYVEFEISGEQPEGQENLYEVTSCADCPFKVQDGEWVMYYCGHPRAPSAVGRGYEGLDEFPTIKDSFVETGVGTPDQCPWKSGCSAVLVVPMVVLQKGT